MFLRRGVVVQNTKTRTSLFELVEVVLGSLHSLVNPKYIARKTMEFLLVIKPHELKRPAAYPYNMTGVVDISKPGNTHVNKDVIKVHPYG